MIRRELTSALTEAARHPLALLSDRATAVSTVVRDLTTGATVTDDRLTAALAGTDASRPISYAPRSLADALAGPSSARIATDAPVRLTGRTGRDTAIVSIRGMALYNVELQPLAFSTKLLAQTMRALAADDTVERVILDIDSPGGSVVGVEEAAEAIFAARQRKPVVAVADGLAASAAYWLAASASSVAVIPSGEVGSIGVFVLHMDMSSALEQDGIRPTFIFAGARKVDGNSLQPLTARARDDMQADVDTFHAAFIRAVARGRGVAVSAVRQGFGEGRTVLAREAVRLGMVDRIGTIEDMIAAPSGARGARQARSVPADRQLSSAAPTRRRRRLELLKRA